MQSEASIVSFYVGISTCSNAGSHIVRVRTTHVQRGKKKKKKEDWQWPILAHVE